ncbi:MAG TPA: trehalase family glycosidase [Victivallales bacterium]|nr:trehalase family glycosidase [Victivallales bacterium]HRU00495.1 trehalase family glycosidase [Victivallales bacterium]
MNYELLRRKNWNPGQLLAFSGIDGKTNFSSAIVVKTSEKKFALDIVLPEKCFIEFPSHNNDNNVSYLIAGDFFELKHSSGKYLGAFIDSDHLLLIGTPIFIKNSDKIKVLQNAEKTLIGSADNFNKNLIEQNIEDLIKKRSKFLRDIKLPERISHIRARTLAKALSLMKTQVYSPQGKIACRWTTPDRWPHRNMWLWDSVFHAIGWRHFDLKMARESIEAVLHMQREDGFIPHMMSPEGCSNITQPPILSYGVTLIDMIAPDDDWIKTLYPSLCAYIRWDMNNRDKDSDGLLEWFIENNENCRSGESGMDNSPRFDSAEILAATDFNSYLALECECLANFAKRIGYNDDAKKWTREYKRIVKLINAKLWNSREKFYFDYNNEKRSFSPIMASSGFLPLLCHEVDQVRLGSLISYLKDPNYFASPLPISSISLSDARYSKDMWRGPVWININWLIANGLERNKVSDIATELRKRTIDEIEKFVELDAVFYEYYDDSCAQSPKELPRKGKCAPFESPYHQVIHDYGWSATLYADIVMNQVKREKL